MTKKTLLIEDLASEPLPSAIDPELPPVQEGEVSFTDAMRDCVALLNKFVEMKPEQAIVTSLWAAATWFVDAFDFVPYLLITSKTKECGKSRLLQCLSLLVKKPTKVSDITPAATFRILSKETRTLLLDEVDQYLLYREGFFSILNDGNTRGNDICRTATNARGGFTDDLKKYYSFGFKAVAGIKAEKIKDTLTSRSIVIQLRKKECNGEARIKIKHYESEFAALRSRFYTLSLRYGQKVQELTDSGTIKFPRNFHFSGRDIDKFEPLWALLNCMADKKTQKVCKVACRRCTEQMVASSEKALLLNIYKIVENIQQESIKTLDLLDKLHLVPEWRDLSPKKLGDILDTFQVKSHHIWRENNARGYFVNQLKQAYFEYK